MRGADDAHVDGVLRGRADFAHVFFLDRPEQLDLHRERQVGDFVEEQSAGVRGLEKPVAVALGARECAFLVTEELALHQVFGNGAAIDRHEGLVAPRPLAMDETSSEFLAASGLAGDVDRGLAARELLDHQAHLFDPRARSEKLVLPGFGGRGFLRQGERRFDQRPELIEGQGLGQIIEGTGLESCDGVLGAAERRDHGHGEVCESRADETHQFHPVAVGQPHVGQTEVIPSGLQQLLGGRHGPGAFDRQAHADERQLEQLADVRLVVYDQHGTLDGIRPPFRAPVRYGACHRILKSAPW